MAQASSLSANGDFNTVASISTTRPSANSFRCKAETILVAIPSAIAFVVVPWAIRAGIANVGCPARPGGHLPIALLFDGVIDGLSNLAGPILMLCFGIAAGIAWRLRSKVTPFLFLATVLFVMMTASTRISIGYITSGATASPCQAAGGGK
jgi:hypothetical protein